MRCRYRWPLSASRPLRASRSHAVASAQLSAPRDHLHAGRARAALRLSLRPRASGSPVHIASSRETSDARTRLSNTVRLTLRWSPSDDGNGQVSRRTIRKAAVRKLKPQPDTQPGWGSYPAVVGVRKRAGLEKNSIVCGAESSGTWQYRGWRQPTLTAGCSARASSLIPSPQRSTAMPDSRTLSLRLESGPLRSRASTVPSATPFAWARTMRQRRWCPFGFFGMQLPRCRRWWWMPITDASGARYCEPPPDTKLVLPE